MVRLIGRSWRGVDLPAAIVETMVALPTVNELMTNKGTMKNRVAAGARLQAFKLATLGLLVLLAAWLGDDFLRHSATVEGWFSNHGWLGFLAFLVVVVVFTSVFVPDTVFAVAAGVMFGALGGTLLMTAAALCTATLNFALARSLLQPAVTKALQSRPTLAAVQNAVCAEGLRFQLLLRLTPLNPVSVNYVLGAGNTPLPTFLLGCVGMIPALVVEVYFGHTAHHVARLAAGAGHPSTPNTVMTLAGLVICVAVMLYFTRVAKRALLARQRAA
jgi:uncharacterized membrane protein YdjX (TVP38/TMEM64 family)